MARGIYTIRSSVAPITHFLKMGTNLLEEGAFRIHWLRPVADPGRNQGGGNLGQVLLQWKGLDGTPLSDATVGNVGFKPTILS